MKSFFNNVKDKLDVGMQYVKEKVGISSTEVDEDYQTALTRLEILKDQVHKYLNDVNAIISIMPDICSSGTNLSQLLVSSNSKYGEHCRELAESFETFFTNIQRLVDEDILKQSQPAILQLLRQLQTDFNRLDELAKNQRSSQLLCNSLRDKIRSTSGNGSSSEAGEIRIKYESTKQLYIQQTEQFKNEVNTMWENRFNMLEVPLQEFVKITFSFCHKCYGHLCELQKAVPQEDLNRDYPV